MTTKLALVIILFVLFAVAMMAGLYFLPNFSNSNASTSTSSVSSSASSISSSSTSVSTSSAATSTSLPLPNDRHFSQQWNLQKEGFGINAMLAWTFEKDPVIVAVIDSGFMLKHEDLVAQIWTNPGEIPNNSIDDDKNGFVDDVKGYNFDNNTTTIPANTGHGTWVSGVIAAKRDNKIGIAGVCGTCTIMPIQLSIELLETEAERAAASAKLGKAIDYAVKNGAQVINMSFSLPAKSDSLQKKITAHANNGVLFVAAAGNSGENIDNLAYAYPALYQNVFAVGAISQDGKKTPSSNYGKKVTLVAPSSTIPLINTYTGSAVLLNKLKTIYNNDAYALETTNGGTSVAAPHVSGVFGIIKSCKPTANTAEITQALLSAQLKVLNAKLIEIVCNN
jgi:subtilisin family serine protease